LSTGVKFFDGVVKGYKKFTESFLWHGI
jgi:hypothetical protein